MNKKIIWRHEQQKYNVYFTIKIFYTIVVKIIVQNVNYILILIPITYKEIQELISIFNLPIYGKTHSY